MAERRTAIQAAVEKIGGRSVNRVLVAGASGYAGALAAELVRRHPSLELARVTARTDAGKRLSELHPRYGVDLILEEPAAEHGEDVDAAIALSARRRRAVVSALREQGVKVVDLSADFRLHDLETYRRWYGGTARRICSRMRSTGSPSSTAIGSRVPSSSPTRAAIRPPACSRSLRSRRRG